MDGKLQVESTTNNNEGEQVHSIVNQLHNLEETDEWALELILSDDSGASIRDAIKEGTCLAVSDGSYKNNRGGIGRDHRKTRGARIKTNCIKSSTWHS